MKKLKLGTKIACGFVVVLLLTAMVGYVGFGGLAGVTSTVDKADDANRMIALILSIRQQEKNYIIRGDDQYSKQVFELVADLLDQARKTEAKMKDKSDQVLVQEIAGAAGRYKTAFEHYVSLTAQKNESDAAMVKNARLLGAASEAMLKDQTEEMEALLNAGVASTDQLTQIKDRFSKANNANQIIKWVLEARRHEKNFIIRGDEEYVGRVNKYIDDIIALAKDVEQRFAKEDNKTQARQILAAAKGYGDAFEQFVRFTKEHIKTDSDLVAAARDVQAKCEEARDIQKKKMQATTKRSNMLMFGGASLAIILGAILAWVITRGITRPINRTIEALASGADQVAAASGQISSASQGMAEGASGQAAAIEETSASLEEMLSMIKQNAANAAQANRLMTEAKSVADKAGGSMKQMNLSMNEIASAGKEIGKIIKTIDEIAFQTNLLALNAAVEAARAGEAGQGFAVVAEEVRHLAQRAAEAAQSTAELIEGTIRSISQGTELVKTTDEDFMEMAVSSGKVAELIGEIAAATSEQAQGIEQLNQAVTVMDQVTQTNAATAEESASASEELNAQAECMLEVVGELISLVNGADSINNFHYQHRIEHHDAAGQRTTNITHEQTRPYRKPDIKLLQGGNMEG